MRPGLCLCRSCLRVTDLRERGLRGERNVDSTTTSATQFYVHGHGADVEGPTDGDAAVLYLGIATTVRDLYVSSHTGGVPIDISEQSSVLENITIRKGFTGLSLSSSASIAGFVYVGNGGTAIELSTGAHLNMDGAVIKGGYRGIRATTAVSVSVSSLLIYGTSGLALDLPYASGTIASSTIADCGTNVATGPRAVSCSSGLTIRSSIIWTPGTSTQVPVSGCNLSSTIAGPVATPGASNADPKFVDPAMRDYHIASDSPARDMVDTGPSTDFEGDGRPQGGRFDIGADEMWLRPQGARRAHVGAGYIAVVDRYSRESNDVARAIMHVGARGPRSPPIRTRVPALLERSPPTSGTRTVDSSKKA